ncbi:MAG: hypothetical protein U5M23_05660 [Marinagarivorans sp.]|nr:hypothetical protein [Marinagarivorans sp.]
MIHRLSWALVLGLVCTTATAKEKPLTEVADLRYGVALYDFFQGYHFAALTELMVADERGGIKGHGDNPEIMKGGFYMAYGLERSATQVFDRLLDANRPQKTRDAAWLYLAKMHYLRNDFSGVVQTLDRIGDQPAAAVATESLNLRFNIAIKQNRLDDARALLDDVDYRDADAPYLYYNLASAYARAQNSEQAINYYNLIAKMRQRSLAHLSLYDKAMTAAGYVYLFDQKNDLAEAQFKRVRLNGPFASQALLGLGWAKVEQKKFKSALAPWQQLATHRLIDNNTQESLVAIPYAYEQLNLNAAALASYRQAEAKFESEIVTLDLFIQNLKGEAMLASLNIDAAEDIDWLEYAQKNQLAPQLSYLAELFSTNGFRGLVQELRDLLDLRRRFIEWQNRMQFYRDMLAERESNRVVEMDTMAKQHSLEKLQGMTSSRQKILAELDTIEQKQRFLALLQGDEITKLQRIERAEGNLALLAAAGEDVSSQRAKLELHRGLLLWQAGQLFAERLWRARDSISDLDSKLTAANGRQTEIQSIVDSGFDVAPYRERLGDSQIKIAAQLSAIDTAINQAQNSLQAEVVKVLLDQRERLEENLAQSRLGIARLLDEADGEQY